MKCQLLILTLIAPLCFADDCTYDKVNAIQVQLGNVLIQVKKGKSYAWRVLGYHTDTHTASYQAIAEQALKSEEEIMLRYEVHEGCLKSEYNEVPTAFRLYG